MEHGVQPGSGVIRLGKEDQLIWIMGKSDL